MKRALSALAALLLAGCVGSWPANMPPETYSGTVYDGQTGKPAPGVQVVASRLAVTPGIPPPFPMDPDIETLAQTRTDKNGVFALTTPSGYAEWLEAKSSDSRMSGRLDKRLKKGGDDLVIKMWRQ